MLRFIRANAVGFLALFVALGGTGYAALKLPRNSVGSSQIRNGAVRTSDLHKNAVTSAIVRNGSIRSEDIAPGTLTQGQPGSQGPKGDQGPAGALGPTEGGSSDVGPTVAREASFDSSAFTTTHAGRVLVSKSISSMSVTCNGGVQWGTWLEVDDTRVPGTLVSAASGAALKGLTLTGVTDATLPAGPHTATFAIDCIGNTLSIGSASSDGAVTFVVLGNG